MVDKQTRLERRGGELKKKTDNNMTFHDNTLGKNTRRGAGEGVWAGFWVGIMDGKTV